MPIDKRVAVASIQLPSVIKRDIMDEFVEQSNVTLFFKSIAIMIKTRTLRTEHTYRILFRRFNIDITITRDRYSLSVSIINGPTISYTYVWFQNHSYTPERLFSVLNYLADHYGPIHIVNGGSLETFRQRHRTNILHLQARVWDETAVLRKSIKDDAIVKIIIFLLK